MKTAIHPGDHPLETPDLQDYQVSTVSDVYTECFNNDIDFNQTNPISHHVIAFHDNIMEIDSNSHPLQEFHCTRNELIMDLMQKVLPDWIRKRWISMLLEIDLASSFTDEKIERLRRESSCARGNLRRLMPDASCEDCSMADTELALLINGFNELANSWRHLKEGAATH